MLHPWKIPDLDGALSSLIQVEDVPAHYTGLDSVTCKNLFQPKPICDSRTAPGLEETGDSRSALEGREGL